MSDNDGGGVRNFPGCSEAPATLAGCRRLVMPCC